MLKRLLLSLAAGCLVGTAWADVPLSSPRAVVMDAETGEILLAKGADEIASIASMTKLMTAMVVLDAQLNPAEVIAIDAADLDTIKFTQSGVPVGALFTRRSLLRLALVSSDNRAAAALARTYPGGHAGFDAAVARKIEALGLTRTALEEPTGLSPRNRSSAADMARVLQAAAGYPEIAEMSSQATARMEVNGHEREFRNTNGLVGQSGWNILVSKTGFTREAGRCVSMVLEQAGRKVLVVLMGAGESAQRARDALNIRRWLAGEPPLAMPAAPRAAKVGKVPKGGKRGKATGPKVRRD